MFKIDRTNCGCERCVAACKCMPGMLVPGDLREIADFMGEPYVNGAVLQHFVASDGAVVAVKTAGGRQLMRIPTIVPKSREDGSCVFLDENDRCVIHEVAPYGCRNFCVHGERTADDDMKVADGLWKITQSEEYLRTHLVMQVAGQVAKPLAERKRMLNTMLAQIDAAECSQH